MVDLLRESNYDTKTPPKHRNVLITRLNHSRSFSKARSRDDEVSHADKMSGGGVIVANVA